MGDVHQLPSWARYVDAKLYWKVRHNPSSDEVMNVLVISSLIDDPATEGMKWRKLNSTSWSVSLPLRLIPTLAQLPGVLKITM